MAAGAAQAHHVPGVLDRKFGHGHEHHARDGIDSFGFLEQCAEAGPGTVEAVARERPAAGQFGPAVLADHPAEPERTWWRCPGPGRRRPWRRRFGHVAGKNVAPRADRRAPAGAAVDRRDALHDVHHVDDRRLDSAEVCRNQQAVDPGAAEGGDDRVGKAAARSISSAAARTRSRTPSTARFVGAVSRAIEPTERRSCLQTVNKLDVHHLISFIREVRSSDAARRRGHNARGKAAICIFAELNCGNAPSVPQSDWVSLRQLD